MGNCCGGDSTKTQEPAEGKKPEQQQNQKLEPVVEDPTKQQQQEKKNTESPKNTPKSNAQDASTAETKPTRENPGLVTSPLKANPREHLEDEDDEATQQQQQKEQAREHEKNEGEGDQHHEESSATEIQNKLQEMNSNNHGVEENNTNSKNNNENKLEKEDDEPTSNINKIPSKDDEEFSQNNQEKTILGPVAANFDFNLSPLQREQSLEKQLSENIKGGSQQTKVFPCFEGGLLFRLSGETKTGTTEKSKQRLLPKSLRSQSWFFYNDTLDLDMKIEYAFGPTSRLQFGSDVVVTSKTSADAKENATNENQNQQQQSWMKCSLVVKPGETKLLIQGIPNGYRSSYSSSINENYIAISPTTTNNKKSSSSPAYPPQLVGEYKKGIDEELNQVQGVLLSSETKKADGKQKNKNQQNSSLIQSLVEESVSRARNRGNNNNNNNEDASLLSPSRVYGENTFCLLPLSVSRQRNSNNSNENKNDLTANEPIEISIRRALHLNQLKFVDLQFPPTDESLFALSNDADGNEQIRGQFPSLTWSRVTIPKTGLGKKFSGLNNNNSKTSSPVSAVDPTNIECGVLGDTWLTCALVALADACPKLIEERMFSTYYGEEDDDRVHQRQKQRNDDDGGTDMVHVCVNKAGWWRDVLLDTFLPMALSKPAFARPRDFSSSSSHQANIADPWVSFAQKAMAKVHGGYGALVGGEVLHALQDLSGYPTVSLSELWSEVATTSTNNRTSEPFSTNISDAAFQKEKSLFDRISRSVTQGHIVMLTTPGLDDDILEEAIEKFSRPQAQQNDAEEKVRDGESLMKFYRKCGLGLGMSYSLKYVYTDKNVKLLQFLNCSGDRDLAQGWKGDWSAESELWKKYPSVANACKSLTPSNNNKTSNNTDPFAENANEIFSTSSSYFWMSWEDCKQFFSDCGVCFVQRHSYETRVVGFFDQQEARVPSIVLEIKNKNDSVGNSNNNNNNKSSSAVGSSTKNQITAMLSQIDSRGLRSDHPAAHGAAMLLSLFQNDDEEQGWYRLSCNSTQDMEQQTSQDFHYTFIRDVSMSFELKKNSQPKQSTARPCYIVPRIHEMSRKADTYFCVSIFSTEPVEINFRSLSADCSVFKNAKAVSHDEWEKCLENGAKSMNHHVQYQVRNVKTGKIENF